MDKIEQINKELAGRVMPDIEYIALLNTKVGILQEESNRRFELLREVLDEIFPHPDTWNEIFHDELIERLKEELG